MYVGGGGWVCLLCAAVSVSVCLLKVYIYLEIISSLTQCTIKSRRRIDSAVRGNNFRVNVEETDIIFVLVQST